MAINCLLLQFNNYFNKKVKKYSTVEDYISHASKAEYSLNASGVPADLTCWNPNDGIETVLNVRWHGKWNPDYLLIIDVSFDNKKIIGRWFIREPKFLSKGNYNFILRRDVVAEKYDSIVNAPCFIQKGFVREESPLIFNKEDFDCNQIKINEDVVCDKSNCAWLTVYYNLSKKSELSGDVSLSTKPAIDIGTTLENWTIYQNFHTNGSYKVNNNKKYTVTWKSHLMDGYFVWHWFKIKMTFDENSIAIDQEGTEPQTEPNVSLQNNGLIAEVSEEVIDYLEGKTDVVYYLKQYGEPATSFNDFFKWDGVLIKTSDNKYYRLHIVNEGSQTEKITLTSGSLYNTLASHFMTGGVLKPHWSGTFTNTFEVIIDSSNYKIYAEEESQSVESFHYDFTSIPSLIDGSYGIIAFPFDNKYRTRNVWKITQKLNLDLGILIAKDMCSSGVGTDKAIFDVQVLPYCPIELPSTIDANGGTNLDPTNVNSSLYTEIKDSNSMTRMLAIHPISCKRTEFINYKTWMLNQFYFATGRYAYKIENQCTFYRLVSPNYNGQFEFNRAKNRNFTTFRLDITYKPYQPYIHLAPIFGGLYGEDFADARGLICGGDFTFGVTSSKFEEYKMQNKNYQDIFNRQIENMDVNYGIDQKYRGINALIGGVAGGVVGTVGASLGNPIGALGGAMASGGAIVNGIVGSLQAREKYAEARDYAIDQHNYQLANIKALPDSLAKVDAYNSNNKLFPILEKYTCTTEEVEIFKNKIKYEGMTVNTIGKIADYIDQLEDLTFIKGQILRLDNLDEDNHFAQEIYNEVAKGLYFEKGE